MSHNCCLKALFFALEGLRFGVIYTLRTFSEFTLILQFLLTVFPQKIAAATTVFTL